MEKHHEYNDQQLIYTNKLRVRMKRSQKIRDQMVKSVEFKTIFRNMELPQYVLLNHEYHRPKTFML